MDDAVQGAGREHQRKTTASSQDDPEKKESERRLECSERALASSHQSCRYSG